MNNTLDLIDWEAALAAQADALDARKCDLDETARTLGEEKLRLYRWEQHLLAEAQRLGIPRAALDCIHNETTEAPDVVLDTPAGAGSPRTADPGPDVAGGDAAGDPRGITPAVRPDDGLDPARGIVWWISGCLVAWVAVVCGAEYLGYPGLRIVAVLAAVVASGYIAWAIRAARENRK